MPGHVAPQLAPQADDVCVLSFTIWLPGGAALTRPIIQGTVEALERALAQCVWPARDECSGARRVLLTGFESRPAAFEPASVALKLVALGTATTLQKFRKAFIENDRLVGVSVDNSGSRYFTVGTVHPLKSFAEKGRTLVESAIKISATAFGVAVDGDKRTASACSLYAFLFKEEVFVKEQAARSLLEQQQRLLVTPPVSVWRIEDALFDAGVLSLAKAFLPGFTLFSASTTLGKDKLESIKRALLASRRAASDDKQEQMVWCWRRTTPD